MNMAHVFALVTLSIGAAHAKPPLRAPPGLLDQVAFEQRLGAQVPPDARFREATGASVRLRDLLIDKPVLLVPGYFGCANLCSAVRAGVAHAVAQSGLKPGADFAVVLVSIDPTETPTTAATTQSNDATAYPAARVRAWHYLTGSDAASRSLMRRIGFEYYYDPRNRQYDHAAGIVLLTANGMIAQYLFGVQFAPRTLRLALVDASRGHIGNVVDRLLLLCCDYDPSTGRYSLIIHRIMQGLGFATALALCGLIVALRRSELRRGTEAQT